MSRSILVFLLCSAFQITLSAQDLSFQTPELVVRGRSFTGIVVDPHTNETPALPEDAQVHTRDFTLRIDTPGIVFPPIMTEGNSFLEGWISGTDGDVVTEIRPRHVEAVPLIHEPDKPVISRVQDIIQPGDVMIVEGLGLERLSQPRLNGQDGRTYPLERRFSSDLQQGFQVPADLPEGAYHFSALNENGTTVKSDESTSYPFLEISGPRIRRKGQKGTLRLLCSDDALLGLIVSEEIIRLIEIAGMTSFPVAFGPVFRTIPAKADEWIEIPFVAREVGQWTATVYTFSERHRPDSIKGAAVEPSVEGAMDLQYDPSLDATTVRQGFSIRRVDGNAAVPDAHVDFVLSHPSGVDYFTEITGPDGVVRMQRTIPGRVTPDVICAAPYRVWEHQYKLAPEQDEKEDCRAEIVCHKPDHCDVICFKCAGIPRNNRFELKAKTSPEGGKRLWEEIEGSEAFKLLKGNERVTIHLNRKAETVDTIRIKFSYTVNEQTCSDTHAIAIQKPQSLKILDEWQFVNNKGVKDISKNGTPVKEKEVPEGVKNEIPPEVDQVGNTAIGVLRLVYYEVLDQHDRRLKCDADLDEALASKIEGLKSGGTKIEKGLAVTPDHIYYVNKEKYFKGIPEILQRISVNDCVLRYNKITITKSGIALEEVDKRGRKRRK